MDPDANKMEQMRLIHLSQQRALSRDERSRLSELDRALRDWLASGGFPPSYNENEDRRIRKALRAPYVAPRDVA